MQTSTTTKTKTKSITNTKLLVATAVLLASAGLSYIVVTDSSTLMQALIKIILGK